jgi:hypothetical protein
MRPDDLDRILSEEQEFVPSSGFVASVMDAVRREAATPPPIPFPWKRALPGLAVGVLALLAVLVAGFALLIRGGAAQSPAVPLPPALGLILEAARTVGAIWIVLGLVLSLVLVKLSMRIGGRLSHWH